MPEFPNPVEALKDYGMSIETIARIAQVRWTDLKGMDWASAPSGDPASIRLNDTAALLDALDKSVQPVDATAFYEEHIVLLKKDDMEYYCRAHELYETGLWSQDDFTDYAATAAFYSRRDFAEDFPLTTRVVKSSDGYSSIVCQCPIPSVDFAAMPDLGELTVIK